MKKEERIEKAKKALDLADGYDLSAIIIEKQLTKHIEYRANNKKEILESVETLRPKTVMGLVSSSAVTRALSLEIILKSLSYIVLENRPAKTHDLSKLYLNLPIQTKKRIQKSFINSKEYKAASNYNKKINKQIKDIDFKIYNTVINLLEEHKDNFIGWRYYYEDDFQNNKEKYPMSNFLQVVYNVIRKEIENELKNKYSKKRKK